MKLDIVHEQRDNKLHRMTRNDRSEIILTGGITLVRGNSDRRCGEGKLPEAAPLANPYVPFQLENPPKYESRKALVRGTLFPGLAIGAILWRFIYNAMVLMKVNAYMYDVVCGVIVFIIVLFDAVKTLKLEKL